MTGTKHDLYMDRNDIKHTRERDAELFRKLEQRSKREQEQN